ncbi:hypothetical protein PGB90_008055 [Kerria lacca]
MLYETSSKYYVTCSVMNNCFFDKGKVLLARHKTSRTLVAIKHFNLEEFTQEQYDLIMEEIFFMRQLKHPNILPCLTSYVINFDLYVVSPLMGFTSCHDLISAHFQDGLSEIIISFFLRDVLRALDYIHSKGYIHRSVKARHILVHADGHACLSGFRYMYSLPKCGSLNKVHHFPLHTSHNLNWFSPELLEQNIEGYDEKSDIYSVGVTACELANGIVPFADTSTTSMLTEKVRGVIPQLIDCTTWFLHDDDQYSKDEICYSNENIENENQKIISRKFSNSFHAFVELCCCRNISIRPLPKQLLNHSFFKPIRRIGINLQELLQPAVPYTETNTTELHEDVAVINDLSYDFDDINIYPEEWDF